MVAGKPMGVAEAMKTKSGNRKSGKAETEMAAPHAGLVSAFPLSAFRICVLGLWHLGSVTAACCAKHFEVAGLDFDAANVARLSSGKGPLLEPGLDDLIAAGLAAKKLSFTTDPKVACAGADVLWLCYDTPVNDQDESDVKSVLTHLRRALPSLPN